MPSLPPSFPEQKPLPYDIAILCEGDATGYEVAILRKWADSVFGTAPFVGVFGCGTADGIFGMTDALGRTTTVAVVEDRDFRSLSDATDDCKRKYRNRIDRGVSIRGWTVWQRSEIENYFLDDSIFVPVFTECFGCSENDVFDALDTAIRFLGIFQAFAATVYYMRAKWTGTDPSAKLSVSTRPKWTSNGLAGPDIAEVLKELERSLLSWQELFNRQKPFGQLICEMSVVDEFQKRVADWTNLDRSSNVCRIDWAGKEVLKAVRQILASRSSGWWSVIPSQPVNWNEIGNRRKQDAHDRIIEREIQPKLVSRLADNIAVSSDEAIASEFDALARMIRS